MPNEKAGAFGAAVLLRENGGAVFNLAALLCLALRNGSEGGLRIGPRTGDFLSFSTVGEVLAAYREQTGFFVRSVFSGSRGGASPLFCVGLAEAGDSFAALDALVYRGKEISPARLLALLDSDFAEPLPPMDAWTELLIRRELFRRGMIPPEKMAAACTFYTGAYPPREGGREIRRKLRNEAPKYGNGNREADRFAAEAARIFLQAVAENREGAARGVSLGGCGLSGAAGLRTGATPDGRAACAPLSEGLAVPGRGTPRAGSRGGIRRLCPESSWGFFSRHIAVK